MSTNEKEREVTYKQNILPENSVNTFHQLNALTILILIRICIIEDCVFFVDVI